MALKDKLMIEHRDRVTKYAANKLVDVEPNKLEGKLLSVNRVNNIRVGIYLAAWLEQFMQNIDASE